MLALRKTSPGAVPPAETVTSMTGGSRSGRDRKVRGGVSGASVTRSSGVGTVGAGCTTPKDSGPSLERSSGTSASTVTSSPGWNLASGTKLTPSPSECGSRTPECPPLSEPITVTAPRSSVATPRNDISVYGDAVQVPCRGNTCTPDVDWPCAKAVRAALCNGDEAATANAPAPAARRNALRLERKATDLFAGCVAESGWE